jgi:hypothetical protein
MFARNFSLRLKSKVLSDLKSSRLLLWPLLAVMVVAALPAFGQGPTHYKIPFAFSVGKGALASGNYLVEPAYAGASMIRLTGPNGAAVITTVTVTRMETLDSSSKAASRLVFHRYGSTYFLTQVWLGRNHGGFLLSRSPAEKEYARNNGPQEELIVVEK